jgi:hypothetical protein
MSAHSDGSLAAAPRPGQRDAAELICCYIAGNVPPGADDLPGMRSVLERTDAGGL